MNKGKQHIEDLWRLYVSGQATAEQLQELFRLLSDPAQEAVHTEAVQVAAAGDGPFLAPDSHQEELTWQLLLQEADGLSASLQPVIEAPVRRIGLLRWGWAAAIAVLLSAGGYYIYYTPRPKTDLSITTKVPEIKPGRQGAVLTLANGRQVLLDSMSNAEIARESGTTVSMNKGQLRYEATGNTAPEEIFNSVSTPVGRQFNLVLPDGSRVWLNAGSSLRYPVAFTDKVRRVTVTGEAYFEIAADSRRTFIVNIGNRAEVKVLGTHFNINAYDNEPYIQTTLVKGVIATRVEKEAPVLLKPGQQARLSHTGNNNIQVLEVPDMDKITAWKRGFFNFQDASLQEVMRTLERWYDVKVVYERGVPDINFGGELSMKISLQGVLNALRKTKVHFRIENGNKVIVTP
ncbi:FecR family protein [Chitinophaga arvensicola]|uniref:FecR protein n=1 Tax=Chitinophaga arvensicola TaxID=29529 RepID=A0A1I0S7F8_9BACT|nr:FecR family protein [Chitinophaga arvensicola]SEW51573.1 FecR protein [Chitinophaga arvensicola]